MAATQWDDPIRSAPKTGTPLKEDTEGYEAPTIREIHPRLRQGFDFQKGGGTNHFRAACFLR